MTRILDAMFSRRIGGVVLVALGVLLLWGAVGVSQEPNNGLGLLLFLPGLVVVGYGVKLTLEGD